MVNLAELFKVKLTGFRSVALLMSLSIIVKLAVVCVPNVAPLVGLDSVKLIVSLGSNKVSLIIGMITILLVSPLAKLTVIGMLL